ncbi:MAG: hypothetical protein Q8P56_05685 [Candidatus Uhrbacteria bacterium]|nr:hypothetical protein [Candidatus Uhrbacteria bacterium]
MTRKTLLVAAIIFAVYLTLGALGYTLCEGADLGRGVRWSLIVMTTMGTDTPATNQASAWFQTSYAVLSFLLVSLALSTIVIPPILHWWDARVNGQATIGWWGSWGQQTFLLVDPVDWEKAESVINELRDKIKGSIVVVVSNDGEFPDLPIHLLAQSVGYVKGNLRDPLTYKRAGLSRAAGAFICASSYDNPTSDARTAAIVSVIERLRPEVITVAEQVCRVNDDLFQPRNDCKANATVVFDEETMKAVARVVPGRRAGTVNANTVDELQQAELYRQLKLAGVEVGSGTRALQIILPSTLDDTSSDFEVWAKLQRAEPGTVALYLSVKSEGLFRGTDNAVCADRVMAKALVAKMQRLLATHR